MPKRTSIPLLDLSREYSILKKDIHKQFQECARTQEWILGPKVSEFEKKIARYLGARFAVGVASGTDALLLSLRSLAMKRKRRYFFNKKDEIITTPFTFIATAEAIVRSGATPVFVDIDPRTFNIDPEKIKKAITKNTVGIVPVHLYGLAASMSPILKIAKDNGLFVLEDAAQSIGGMYKAKKLATFGTAGALSFFPSKNLGSIGDAGLAVTDERDLAENIRILRNHGQKRRYDAEYIGYNSRLDSIQAGVLLAKLKKIDRFNRMRRRIAAKYTGQLKGLKEIAVPFVPKECHHVYHLYTIKVSSKRNQLLAALNAKGVGARIYYPIPLHKMKAFKKARRQGGFKVTEDVLSKILSLPIHPFLKDAQISYITSVIRSFFKGR